MKEMVKDWWFNFGAWLRSIFMTHPVYSLVLVVLSFVMGAILT